MIPNLTYLSLGEGQHRFEHSLFPSNYPLWIRGASFPTYVANFADLPSSFRNPRMEKGI